MTLCKTIGCNNRIADPSQDFYQDCQKTQCSGMNVTTGYHETVVADPHLPDRNPYHFRSVKELTEVDVFAVHHIFAMNDPSGALHYASRKLLLSGVGVEGGPNYNDIRKARDTLTRWLELNATCH